MGTLNPVASAPSEPFSPDDPYPVTLAKIRLATVEAARNFMIKLESGGGYERNYRFGEETLHGTDCSGLLYRILSGHGGSSRLSAENYYEAAVKDGSRIDDPLRNIPQPGDLFFYSANHSVTEPSVSHTGFVEQCRENNGAFSCSIISAAGEEGCPDATNSRCRVARDEIIRDAQGNWGIDYNADNNHKPDPSGQQGPNAYFFADSLKMRGIPSPEEVNPLGGVDLNVPFPLDSNMLGMGDLKGFKLSSDGTAITLYASKTEERSFLARGVNLSDVQEILNSLYRTGGQAPAFTLLPDASSQAAINGALTVAGEALAARQGFYPNEVGQILYGENVWRFLGVQNPESFTMQAIFSDPALRNTHVGDVLMASDLLLKTLAMGDEGDQIPTPYFKQAEALAKGKKNVGVLETSRFWFNADPASFVIRKMMAPDGSAVYDFADMQLHVSCAPIQFGGSEGTVQDTAEACESGSLSAWYAASLNDQATMQEIISRHPILQELKELYKAAALAEILYQNGIHLPDSSLDSSEGSPWEVAETAEFLPVLYVGQIGGLLATAGGGVNLDVDLSKVVRDEGQNAPWVDTDYFESMTTPISDVSTDVRALRIKLKNKPSAVAPSPVTWGPVPPEFLHAPDRRWVDMPPIKPMTDLFPDDEKQWQDLQKRLSFLRTFYPDDLAQQEKVLREFATHLFYKILLDADPNPTNRQEVLRRLRDIGPEVVVPMLIEKLRGENPLTPDVAPYERALAARLLVGFSSAAAEALPALKQALNDSNSNVREAAAWTLKQIDPAGFPAP